MWEIRGHSLAVIEGSSDRGEKMIELEHAMIYTREVAGPVEAKDGSESNPRRQFWQM